MKTNYIKQIMLTMILSSSLLSSLLHGQTSDLLCPTTFTIEYNAGPHKVYFVGSDVSDCSTTYTYCVQGVSGNAISHWGFAFNEEAYACLNNEDYDNITSSSGCNSGNYGTDGSTGVDIIKFDCGGMPNGDCDCFSVQVPGVWELSPNSIDILVKYGNNYVVIPVAGPSCQESCDNLTEFTCDDGNPCTVNDKLSKNCSGTICIPCMGTLELPDPPSIENFDVCIGTSTTIIPTGCSDAGSTIKWYSDSDLTQLLHTGNSYDTGNLINPTSFYLTCQNANGCESPPTELNIGILELTNIDITGDNQVCLGSSILLTASGGVGYEWSTGETSSQIEVSPTEMSTYTVTVTGNNGCTDETSISVNVNPLPHAEIDGNQPICTNESITLTTLPGEMNYLWSNANTTQSISINNPLDGSIYSVTVTDENGCTDDANVNLEVNDPPVVEIQGNPICEGDIVELTASTDYTGNFEYVWNPTANTEVMQLTNYSNGDEITVTVTDMETGCWNSDTYILEVMEAINPQIAGNSTICNGNEINLSVTPVSEDYTYTWSNGNTGSETTINPESSGSITVVVSNGMGCDGSDEFFYTVNELPDVEIEGDAVCQDESLELTAISEAGNTYEWNTGSTTSNIEILEPVNNTLYSVTVTDTNNCTDEAEIQIIVNETPTTPIVNDDLVCKGTSAVLQVQNTCSGTLIWYDSSDNLIQSGGTSYVIDELNENLSLYVICQVENCNSDPAFAIASVIPPCDPSCTTEVSCDDGDVCTIDGSKIVGSDGNDCTSCLPSIPIETCGEEFCTYTVGWWGNQGIVTGTINEIIQNYGVDCDEELGLQIAGYCLSEECIDYILPGQPKHKPNKVWCGVSYDNNNNLLRQIIGMTLNVYNDQNLGSLDISNILCASSDIQNFASTGWTINELISNASDCFIGYNCHGFSEGDYMGILGAISVAFDECQINLPCDENNFNYIPTNDAESEYEELLADEVKIYPNPAREKVNLVIFANNQTDYTISFYDINGKIVSRKELNAIKGKNEITLDLSNIKNGIYLLNVNSDSRNNYSKIIIQH